MFLSMSGEKAIHLIFIGFERKEYSPNRRDLVFFGQNKIENQLNGLLASAEKKSILHTFEYVQFLKLEFSLWKRHRFWMRWKNTNSTKCNEEKKWPSSRKNIWIFSLLTNVHCILVLVDTYWYIIYLLNSTAGTLCRIDNHKHVLSGHAQWTSWIRIAFFNNNHFELPKSMPIYVSMWLILSVWYVCCVLCIHLTFTKCIHAWCMLMLICAIQMPSFHFAGYHFFSLLIATPFTF